MTDPNQPNPAPPPPDPYQPPVYYQPQPVYPYGYQPQKPTEGLAIASLVVSCAAVPGLCAYGVGGLLGIVGAIMGHVARRRIARNGSGGAGLALAGIITGWVVTAVVLLIVVAVVVIYVVNPSFS